MIKEKIIIKQYSEAFKQQVVSEYVAGASCKALQRKYGIKGNDTIQKWVRKYGPAGLRTELVVIQRSEERERERELRERVSQLEQAVAQLTLDKIVLESTLAEAEHLLGTEVKKKRVQPSSNGATTIR